MPGRDDSWFADPYAVQQDDELVEDLRAGQPGTEPVTQRMAALRDEAIIYQQLSAERLLDVPEFPGGERS